MHKGSNNSWSFKKSVVTLLAVLVIGIGTFGNARPAHAQWSVPVLESMTLSQNIWKRVLENVGQFLLKAGTVALVDTVSQYGNALAERTAKYIVTGDWGGGPLVETAPWDDYLEDAAYGATGEFLQTFSDSVTITGKNLVCTGGGFTKEGGPKGGLPCKKSSQCKDEFHAKTDPEYKDGECKKQTFGLNLCTPNAPYLLYAIPAALFSEAVSGQFFSKGDPGKDKGSISGLVHEPRCDFKRILESWEELAEEQDPTTFFSGFSTIFEEGQSDISIINNASLQSQLKTLTASYEAELRRQAGSSYKAVTGMVSGVVITPKEEVARGAEAASPQTFNERSQDTFNAFIASGEGALVAIAGRFISTLGSTLIDKYFGGGGAIPVADKGSDSGFNFSGQYSQGGSRARAFEAQYANVFTPKLREISSIDIVTEFSSCPDQYPQQNNCVIDGAFQQAIKGFDAGNEYTVKTAIEDGLLHGDWDLVPPDDTARNESKFCANEAYCYSNLVKLRRARIIPLGWEIAAKEVIENGPVTLRTVMEGFNDCNFQLDPQGIADDEHPYCHLIDPDWVFRAPLMQCRAKVYGPLLQSAEGAIRQEVCVDDPTCVAVDENGQCKGAWGYCTREKNVWSFSGQSCAEHYASCATLTNREGSTVSYLTNTIDNNFCTEANVGCRAYFLERGTELGSWDSLGDVVHLNQFGETCSEQNKGCTELQTSSFESVYVQIAPDDLGCTGSVDDPFECIDYAQICKPEEVGCNLFEPTNGDPAVAAVATLAKYTAGGGSIISWNDQCDASCVGYSQFAQQPTHIEPQGAIDYFIPTTAKQCSAAEVGCTSFTDLEVAGQGGETVDYYSSLRMCIKLSDAKNDTFYTWEGSDTAGYQLKSYQMKVDVGPNVGPKPFTYESGAIAPEYASKDNLELTDLYISCNMNSYADKNIDPDFDPDCREFFDKNGKRSYRLLSRLVFASDDCHPLRRNDVVAKDICVQTGGELVTDATGTFKGVCIYKALPDLSSTCGEEANGCREYRGNSAGAGQIVFADGFENGEVGNWMGGKISSEAVSVGSSSIHQGGGFPLRSPDFGIKTKKNYTVSFWAKGSGVMDFRFFVWKSQEPYKSTFQAEISTSQSIELDGVWRPYTIGPFAIDSAPINLAYVDWDISGGESDMFIDTVIIKEADNTHYLVKDSWNTPNVCDANLNDNLPGSALGCREYENQDKKLEYLTAFTKVCREEIAGCQAFINTHNSTSSDSQLFNTGTDADSLDHPEDDILVPSDDIIYVVKKPKVTCSVESRGCTEVGLASDSGGHTTTYIKNDPDKYESQLCKAIENGCDSYVGRNQALYFKDPGSKTCVYQPKIEFDGQEVSGWFKTVAPTGDLEPCDPGFIVQGNNYGIWKNGDANYDGYVGLCPESADQCTAFVDRSDLTAAHPEGKSYYFLDNEAIDTGSCNGEVSQQEGCVLFDNTNNPSKTWSASLTNAVSEQSNGQSVAPEKEVPLPELFVAQYPQGGAGEPGGSVWCSAEVIGKDCKIDPTPSTYTCHARKFKCIDKLNKNSVLVNVTSPMDFSKVVNTKESPIEGQASFIGSGIESVGSFVFRDESDGQSIQEPYPGPFHPGPNDFQVMCKPSIYEDVKDFCLDQWKEYGFKNHKQNTIGATYALCQGYLTAEAQELVGIVTGKNNAYTTTEQIADVIRSVQAQARLACGSNDSNAVIKVKRDRACTEWLACKTSFTVWDQKKGESRDVCIDVGSCRKWDGTSTEGKCVEWVSTDLDESAFLSKEVYTSRDTGWFGEDYTGYSLYNQFQISNLKSVVTNQANKTVNIGYIHPKESKHDECESAGDGKLCTYEQELPGGASKEMNGVCYKEKCFVAPSALFNPSTKQPHLTDKSCRAFPEQASPFPPSVVLSGGGYNSFGDPISKSDSHRNANVCQKVDADETLQQCLGCSYQKVTYGPSGTFTKYYDSNATLPGGVCYGGFINSKANISKDGKTCDSTAGCTDERGHIAETERLHGSCQIKKTKQDVIGLDGYCLENDLRNTINGSESQFACQTWYPATLFSGGVDIFNQHVGAGYQVPTNGGGRYMCTKARGNANRVGTSVAVDTSRDSSGFGQFLDDFAKKRNNLCHVFGQGNTIYNKETGQNVSCDLSWHTLFNRPVGLIPGEQKCFENVGDGGVSAAGSCNGMWEHAKQFIPNEIMATYTHLDAHEDYYLQSQGYKLVANSFFAQCNDNCSVRRMASILPKTPHEENPKQYPGYNRVEGSYVLHANKDLRIEDVERAEVYIVRGIAGQGGKDNQYNWYPERKPMTIFSDGTFIGPVEVKADGGKPWDLASGPNEHYMSKTFDKNNRTTMRMYWQNDGWFEMTENEIENKMGTRNDYNATGKSFCYSKYWNRLLVDVVFDNNGQFESVDYRICDSGGGSGQLRFAVIFYLREYCTEVAQVFNQDAVGSLSGSTNMAWTDHVKEDSKFILSPNNVTDTYTASNLLSAERSRPSYSVDQLIAPYGISESLFAPDKTKEIPWVFATGGTTSGANGVTEFVNSGSPLSCPQTSQHVAFNQEGSFTISLGSQNESCGVAMCIGGKNHGARCNDISDCGDERTFSSGTDQVIDKGVCMGVPIHPDDQEPADSGDAFTRPLTFQGLHVPNSIHGSNAELTGSLLANVFARAYGAWEWVSESGNATYKEIGSSPITDPELPRKIINGTEPGLASLKSSTSSSSKQTYNSRRYGDELHPPIVSGVDCSGGICDKSTYSKLTINSKNEGFIIGGSGTLAARARFYAEAGTNQMPLRRIAIDWEGNGEEVADFNGMYKNRKPACEGSKFGSSEAACDSGFYQFIHVYSFSDCLNNNTDFELRTVGDDSQGKIVSGVTGQVFDPYAYGFVNGDRYCAFQPSVQIMDNWGWCNGSCESYSVPNSVAGEPNLNFKGCWEDLNSTDDDDPKLCTANEGGFDNASDSFKGWVIIKENIDS